MNNQEFRQYIGQRLSEIRKAIKDPETDQVTRDQLSQQQRMLESADRMGRYSSGQQFRRFRRDYERRLKKT